MGDNEFPPAVIKDDEYVLEVSTLVQLQKLSDITCKVIFDALFSIKEGDYYENLTCSRLIDKLSIIHMSASSISCGVTKITKSNKKCRIVKRMVSEYRSQINNQFKRNTIIGRRSLSKYYMTYLKILMTFLNMNLPQTAVKRNLPLPTQCCLKRSRYNMSFLVLVTDKLTP